MSNILFTPHKINNLEIKNRIIMAAMHLAYAEDKNVSKKDIEFYRARSKGGAGAIVVVAGVNDLSGPPDMHSVGEDKYMEGMKNLADILHKDDCKLFVQLFHGGRNGHPIILGGKDPIAPSPIPSPIYKVKPREMTIEDINSTIDDFGKAALRCKNAGVDGVEISCSVGYLLTQFLSPLTNKRTDEYGGSKENRMRFPQEVIKEIRKCVGEDYPVTIRISGSDMLPGGYGIDYMQEFCSSIEPWIDAINVTGGWHEAPVPQITAQVPEGGFAFLAESIKRVVDIPVIASNRINNGEIAEEILQKGMADFVSVGRAFLADAEFANKVKEGKSYNRCQACNKGCIERALKGLDVHCAFNPTTGKEYLQNKDIAKENKNILVIGAGPAGMEAAKRASLKGHKVTLCDKDNKLGGLLNVASMSPNKQNILKFIENAEAELNELGVNIKLNTDVDKQFIESMNPDYVIVATGSTPIMPHIEGLDEGNIYFAEDVLKGDRDLLIKIKKGKTVIIGGNAVGLETAHYLAKQSFVNSKSINFVNNYIPKEIKDNLISPLDITIVEAKNKSGKDLGGTRWIVKKDLNKFGIKIMTNTNVLSIKNNEICVSVEGEEKCIPADNIILATGYKSVGYDLIKYLDENNYNYKVIGDAKRPKDAMAALNAGYKLGSKIN